MRFLQNSWPLTERLTGANEEIKIIWSNWKYTLSTYQALKEVDYDKSVVLFH